MNKLKTFIFYDEYLDALNTLSDEKAGRMIKRICKFIYTDEPLEQLTEADEKYAWSCIEELLTNDKEIEANGTVTVRHIQLYLDTFGRKPQRGLVKLKKDLPEKVNFRELARQKILTSNSAYRLKKLNANIQTKTAEKICEFYDLNFKEYFEVIETEQFYAS